MSSADLDLLGLKIFRFGSLDIQAQPRKKIGDPLTQLMTQRGSGDYNARNLRARSKIVSSCSLNKPLQAHRRRDKKTPQSAKCADPNL